MEHFYFVADWGAKHYLTVPNVMISAGSTWHPKSNKFSLSRTNLPPDTTKRVFLDSGGFSLMSRYPDYPFSLEEYIDLAYHIKKKYPLTEIATLDYPCEAEIDRTQLHTNQERMEKTVERAVECIDYDGSLPWVPVIQGYTLGEYYECIDMFDAAGIDEDYYAIGSVCSRKGHPLKIRRLITKVKKRMGDDRLHAFGLSLIYLKDSQIFHAIHSSDSAAWNYRAVTMKQKPKMITDYLKKINNIQSAYEGQTTL